jgi:NhaP-type Na+/H+ or K+/H+ antiporter
VFDPLVAADNGFTFADEFALALAGFGLALFAGIGALSHQHERAFSASITYLALGGLLAGVLALLGIPPVDPFKDSKFVEHLSELALVMAIFTTGMGIERKLSWRGWRSVVGLLAVVMPLSIAAVAAFGVLAMGLSLGAAIILGAALAPTDPVLAGDVGVAPPGEESESEANFTLGTEAALNDGLASPFVLLGIFVAGESGSGWLGEWVLADVVYAVVVGVAIGALGGRFAGALAVRLRDARLLDQRLDLYFAVPTALVLFGAAEFVGAYGLVAVFAAGFAFRRVAFHHEHHRHVHEGAEVVEKFGELLIILLLGSMITFAGLEAPGVAGWLLVPLLIVVIRPGLVLALLARSRMEARERAFVAWFGVRGVAALYYAVVAVGAGVLSASEELQVFWTIAACVVVSIVVHGFTATAFSRRLPDE